MRRFDFIQPEPLPPPENERTALRYWSNYGVNMQNAHSAIFSNSEPKPKRKIAERLEVHRNGVTLLTVAVASVVIFLGLWFVSK
jgi:hypothetical protein